MAERPETGKKKEPERPQSGHAYGLMFEAAAERLRKHAPEDIARKAGVTWDAESSALRVPSMGEIICVDWPSCRMRIGTRTDVENWQNLVVLHYLDLADGTPVLAYGISSGISAAKLITMKQVPDGLIRGTKFEFTAERTLERILRGRTPEQLRAALRALDAAETDGKGDLCFCIPFLPRFPVFLQIWFADEDFPASGHLYLDISAGHYLTIEDAVTVGEIVLNRLERELNAM